MKDTQAPQNNIVGEYLSGIQLPTDSWLTASSRVTARQHAHLTYVTILQPNALPLTKPRNTLRYQKTIECLCGSPLPTDSCLTASSRLTARQHAHPTCAAMPLPDALHSNITGIYQQATSRAAAQQIAATINEGCLAIGKSNTTTTSARHCQPGPNYNSNDLLLTTRGLAMSHSVGTEGMHMGNHNVVIGKSPTHRGTHTTPAAHRGRGVTE
jgi:hypothetical protein